MSILLCAVHSFTRNIDPSQSKSVIDGSCQIEYGKTCKTKTSGPCRTTAITQSTTQRGRGLTQTLVS